MPVKQNGKLALEPVWVELGEEQINNTESKTNQFFHASLFVYLNIP